MQIRKWWEYKTAAACSVCGNKFIDDDMVAGKGLFEAECITCHKEKLKRNVTPLQKVKLFGGKK